MRLTYFIPLALIPFAFGTPLARVFAHGSDDAVGKTDISQNTGSTPAVRVLHKRPQVQNEPQQRDVSPENDPQEDDDNWGKRHSRSHGRSSTSCDDPSSTSTRAPLSTKTTSSPKTTYSTKASTGTRATDPAKTSSKTKTSAASETKSYHHGPEASAVTVVRRGQDSVDHSLNPDHAQYTLPECFSNDDAIEIACLRGLVKCMHQYCDRIGTIVPPVPDPASIGDQFCKYRMLPYPLNITDEKILAEVGVIPYDWLYGSRFCPGWNLTQDPGARSGNKKRDLAPITSIASSQATFTESGKSSHSHHISTHTLDHNSRVASPILSLAAPTLHPHSEDVDPDEINEDLTDLIRKCQNLDSKIDDPWLISLCNALAGTLPAGIGPILPVRDTTPSADLQKLLGFCDLLKDKPDQPYTAILEYICPFIGKLKNLPPSGSGTTQVISASSTASPADVQAAISSALGLVGSIFPLGGVEKQEQREGHAKRQELDLTGGHLDIKPGSVINDPLPNPNAVPDRAADDQDDKSFLSYGDDLDQGSQEDANFFANGGNNNDQDDDTDNDFFEHGSHNGTPDDDGSDLHYPSGGANYGPVHGNPNNPGHWGDPNSSSGGDNYGPIHGDPNDPGHGGGRPPTNGDPGAHCEDPDEVDPWRKNTCRPSSQKPTGSGGSNAQGSSSYASTTGNTVHPTSKSDDPNSAHSTRLSNTGTSTQHTSATSTGASDGAFGTSDCTTSSGGIVVSGISTASGHLSSTLTDPRDSTKNPDTATSKKTSPTRSASSSATATSTGDGIAISETSGSHGRGSPTSSGGYGSSSFGDGNTRRTSTSKATDPITSTKGGDGGSRPTSSAGYGFTSSGDGRTHTPTTIKATDPVSTAKSGDGVATTPGSYLSTATGHGGGDSTKTTKDPNTASSTNNGGAGTKTTDTADASNGSGTSTSTWTDQETKTRGSHTRATGRPSSTQGYYGSYGY